MGIKHYRTEMKKTILLVWVAIVLAACAPAATTPLPPLPTITPARTETASADWISVYFTAPDSPIADTYRGGPDEALAAAIDEARFSVDTAIYHFNLWSLRDALLAAHRRGVTVRIVTESDNLDEIEIQELIDAGIPTVNDARESLMHHKFVVIDGHEVWTGSMNFTINGSYKNDNNLVRVRSSQLAENYLSEFEEMFSQELFGDYIGADTPHPSLVVNGTRVETYFSPDDGTATRIVKLIQNAEENVTFSIFSFTSDEIADALIQKSRQGVTVVGVLEEGQYYANQGTEFDNLLNAEIDIHLDGNTHNMHHKFLVIDNEIVITGSYNFSRSAEERNDENTLVIHNAEIAAQYLAEFERINAKATGN